MSATGSVKTPASKAPSTTAATKAPSTAAASTAGGAIDEQAKRLEKLEARSKAVNTNNIARVANSQLTSADEKLTVLHALKTDRPLERFPETPAKIARMTDTMVDQMLLALEAERSGTAEAKRERLRVQLGLKPNPA
ncbi:hypothetical protein B0A49_01108 [Cryomyces minteri]|uniref:Uncharacterized protein n=1 Tax=Cryomyces minteri TaxID=331657 RepID=A0A4U0XTT9_9PEZI|nr:hypothetical protein B0A49_01108 [Cryomyces minteri]